MGMISRGVKNAFRNSIRTVAIIFILAVSISMALVMFMALKTVNGKIDSVKSSIGNTITVSPAGIRGFEGGGSLLTQENAETIKNLANITSVTETLTDRLRNENDINTNFPGSDSSSTSTTNLNSPTEAGSFGNRQRNFEGQSQSSSTTTQTPSSMPINVTGVNELSNAALNVSELDITSGEKIDPTSSENIAMVGKDLAEKNSLSVDSTFTAYGQTIKVVGVYDTGNTFTNASIIMPIKAVQSLSGQNDQVNSLIVETASIDTIPSVQSAIKEKLGSSVDVTSSQDRSEQATESLQNIKTISFYSLIGSLIAGAVIIFLVMVMIVRERRREIGVLKAIGASNIVVTGQFVSEALTLTLISSFLGVILGIILSNPILKVLVSNSQSAASGPGEGGPGRMMRMGIEGMGNTLNNLHAVIGIDILFYGLLAAILIAVVGSAVPSFLISKIRPAEVMRAE